MIIWLILFVIILAISFYLAYLSMKDYQEVPGSSENGIYLIRAPHLLTAQTLSTILEVSKGQVISLERLFKGKSQALVIFGPKKILAEKFSDVLNLLELEDYTATASGEVSVWEVALKGKIQEKDLFESHPSLPEDEQFFWQVILSGGSAQIRAILVSQDHQNKRALLESLENLGSEFLTKVPRPFTNSQMKDFYKKRVFTPTQSFKVTSKEALILTGLLHK